MLYEIAHFWANLPTKEEEGYNWLWTQNACKMLSIFNFLFFPYLRSEGHPWDLFNPNCLLSTALLVQHSSPLCTNACAPDSAGPTDFSYLPIVIAIASTLSKLSKIKSKCKKPKICIKYRKHWKTIRVGQSYISQVL